MKSVIKTKGLVKVYKGTDKKGKPRYTIYTENEYKQVKKRLLDRKKQKFNSLTLAEQEQIKQARREREKDKIKSLSKKEKFEYYEKIKEKKRKYHIAKTLELFGQELPRLKDRYLKKLLSDFINTNKFHIEAEVRYLVQDILFYFEQRHYVEVYFQLPGGEALNTRRYCDILVPNKYAIEIKGANRHQFNNKVNKQQDKDLAYAVKTDARFKKAKIVKISINRKTKEFISIFDFIRLLFKNSLI